jgi:Tfp pilus assembly protein PilX
MKPLSISQRHARQRGSVLLLSLFMLMVMTLLALSAIKMGTVNLRTINNMQMRSEAMSAAQNALDQVMSTNFTDDLAGTARNWSVAVDAGKTYSVAVARPCIRLVTPIMNTVLDYANSEDAKCYDTASNPYSACATTVWEITATVSEGWFGANVAIIQGTGIRMDNGTAGAYSGDSSYRCS